jgi:hypothetical protein
MNTKRNKKNRENIYRKNKKNNNSIQFSSLFFTITATASKYNFSTVRRIKRERKIYRDVEQVHAYMIFHCIVDARNK